LAHLYRFYQADADMLAHVHWHFAALLEEHCR